MTLLQSLGAVLLASWSAFSAQQQPATPFSETGHITVLIFARTDCPITNRYAPEIARLADEFRHNGVEFYLVYPDRSETDAAIDAQIREYSLPEQWVRDPDRRLVKMAEVTVAPEAAVFNRANQLLYHGRIDDRWVAFGKSRPTPQTHDLELVVSAAVSGKPVPETQTRAIGCSLADSQ